MSILNSQFNNNATASSPASGRADILLFGYNQDLTITNVVIDSPGAFAQKAIQMRGIEELATSSTWARTTRPATSRSTT